MGLQALVKGWTGELRTKFAEGLFLDQKVYRVFNNVLINTGAWTTQIDHVIVSRYGIFVIETKNKCGWIYGKPSDKHWTQTLYTKKYKFQNPLVQNQLHIQNLAKVLKVNIRKMHSIIVFWGDCKFQTPLPSNVLNNNLTGYVHNLKQILLSDKEVDSLCQIIQEVKDNTSFLDGWRHSKALSKRFKE